MKKTIPTLLCFLISAGICTAQEPPKVTYQGDMNLGYSIGIGTFSYKRINIHVVNSARIGRYTSLGIGIGIDIWTDLEDMDGKKYTELAMPIYFNAKGYLPIDDKTELYISADIGASIGVSENLKEDSGLMFLPSMGVRFKAGNKGAVSLGLGYVLQKWSVGGLASINTDAIQLRLGFSF